MQTAAKAVLGNPEAFAKATTEFVKAQGHAIDNLNKASKS